MGSCRTIFALLVAVSAILIFVKVKPIFDVPEKPDLGEKWWKTSRPAKIDKSIRPFKIQIADEILQDLKWRLDHAIPLQKSLQGTNQRYGINDKVLQKIIDFWRSKYNWKERETFLNKYPQFKTNIQGLDIHFLHVKPSQTKGLKVLPLLLVHGWPGSVREFYELIPLLTTPREGQKFVFELIIPSLPGFVFSDAAEVPGLSAQQMSVIFKNLMTRLGFEKYYVQGGDWGSAIVSTMATLFPEKIIGMHSNMCTIKTLFSELKLTLGSLYPSLLVEEKYQHLVYPRSDRFAFLLEEGGYFHIQATKPDTVGVGLRDSPVGLAAYILEKFIMGVNHAYRDLEDGGLNRKFKMEDLLDNVMLYWVTRTMTTASRIYAETYSKEARSLETSRIPTDVPAGCAQFVNDIVFEPESILRDKYRNLMHLKVHDGGHFAAFEVPQVLADDVIEFVEKVEKSLGKTETKK